MKSLIAAVQAALIAYPGITAALGSIIIVAAARLGLHLTLSELAGVAAALAAVAGVFVHTTTVPKAAIKASTARLAQVAPVVVQVVPVAPVAVAPAPVAPVQPVAPVAPDVE